MPPRDRRDRSVAARPDGLTPRLLIACALLAGALGACADADEPGSAQSGHGNRQDSVRDHRHDSQGDPRMQAVAPAGPIELMQGVPWRDPDTGAGLALSEVSAGEGGHAQARLSLLGRPGATGWEPGVVLHPGEIFPFAGRFFELLVASAGAPGQRAGAQLRPVDETGGIAAPAAGSLVLVEGGRAKVDGRWLALTGIEATRARLEHWPAERARSSLAEDAVARIALGDGEQAQIDGTRYRIIRIQPRAGSLLAFVEFARD